MAERTTKVPPTHLSDQPSRPGSRDALDQLLRSRRSRRDRPPGFLTWARSIDLDRRFLIMAVLVVVVAIPVGWWLVRPASPPVEARLPVATTRGGEGGSSSRAMQGGADAPVDAGAGSPSSVTASAGPLVVHVAGAVAHPGVVTVPAGSRVGDALAAAGGTLPGADVDRLNLAQPLSDGVRVLVPLVGAPTPPDAEPSTDPSGTGSPSTGRPPTEPIDLNTATAEELDTLPGVGPSTASAIVAHREEHGPFDDVEALLDVRGIGPAKLEALRGAVTINGT